MYNLLSNEIEEEILNLVVMILFSTILMEQTQLKDIALLMDVKQMKDQEG